MTTNHELFQRALESQDQPLSPDAQRRFLRLMWQTDFADPVRAADVLDHEPLYAFPRNARVFGLY